MNIQHACFSCRKAWKKPIEDFDFEAYERESEYVCPDCRTPLKIMGKNFRAPKKEKIKEWDILAELHARGFRFVGNGVGSYLYPKLPTRKSEIEKFIEENPNHYMKLKSKRSEQSDSINSVASLRDFTS